MSMDSSKFPWGYKNKGKLEDIATTHKNSVEICSSLLKMSAHTTAHCFSFISLLLLFCLSLSNTNNASPTRVHNSRLIKQQSTSTSTPNSEMYTTSTHTTKPNVLFQVTKPIDVPNTLPCKQLLFQHQFGNTGGTPSVIVDYTGPPSHCASNGFSKIVLEWSGTCNGTQWDTVFGVWLSGVELLRSSPAQPDNTSLSWEAQKDITRYSSLLLKKDTQKLAVFLRNKLESYLVGVYHVTISISFYPVDGKSGGIGHGSGMGSESKADLILPISQNLHTKGGLWFQIKNSTDEKKIEFKIPQNAYRAVLEVYVSPHSLDTYWYFNHLPEFHNSNQVEDVYTNGPFRDIVIELDSVVVGAIWPYPVTYEAGSNAWNPIVSIRSFDLPSYDIELTPFLGNMLDDGSHNLSFGIGNAINVWYVDANLHLWLDHKSQKTEAKLVANESQPLHLSSKFMMKGLNGESSIQARRMISSEGWVKSSYGNITVQVTHNLSYTNYIHSEFHNHDVANPASIDRVEQVILWNGSVSFIKDSVYDYSSVMSSMKNFSLAEVTKNVLTEGEGNAAYTNNITLGYSDVRIVYGKSSGSEFSTKSSLKDEQSGMRDFTAKNFTWYSGLQDMKRSYNYTVDEGQNRQGNKGDQCYFRNIRSINATVVHDNEVLMLIMLSLFNTNNASLTHNREMYTHSMKPLQSTTNPNVVFQVTKPIDVPNTLPCKKLLLQHEFGSTEGKPSVIVDYSGPPSRCASNDFSKIVLEWSGAWSGTQMDTVFGVWLSGVEILRSSPAQPYEKSLSWKGQKDITRYSSLLLKKDMQKLAVFFRNTLDSYRVGIYNVTINISFYPTDRKSGEIGDKPRMNLGMGSESKADLILPIFQNLYTKGGLWFQIKNSTDGKKTEFKIPQNAYRAVLEVYVSSHYADQYWYSNYLPEYYNSNQFDEVYTNGPFRDVVIGLDDVVVGAIWPYTGLNGESSIQAQRMISSEGGWVKSSYGNSTVQVTHNLSYTNYINVDFDGNCRVDGRQAVGERVEQLILWNDNVSFIKDSVYDYSVTLSMNNFSLVKVEEDVKMEGEGTVVDTTNTTLGYSDVRIVYGKSLGSGFSTKSSLKDEQSGSSVSVAKNYTWVLCILNDYSYRLTDPGLRSSLL
ncbi:Peptide-N4-(N-acetyl-beta-glucosaminyl)asparagineamidase A [Linum perenne]